jgi:HNH endonuclease
MAASHSEAAKARWQRPEYRERARAARRSPLTVEQRIRAKISPPEPSGCRRWQGSPSKNGYARYGIRVDGRTVMILVHRFIYEAEHGPIPAGLTVDHVKDRGCLYKDCCELSHLEAVTHRENVLRSDGPAARNARKTHCPKGHPYDYVKPCDPNHRRCLACEREQAREASRRRRAQQPPKPRVVKTHCPQGHPYDEANTMHYNGRRHCRACNLERSREYQRRKHGHKPRGVRP